MSSKRQHGTPHVFKTTNSHENAEALTQVTLSADSESHYNEYWLQQMLVRYPELLPVNEIEPAFGRLIPVCCELPTAVGPLDILYVNEQGLLTVVECKLWRNPEARREVVGQILDYAKELSRWSYEDLQASIAQATGKSGNLLYQIASEGAENLDEARFVDNVSRNLRQGRFMLMIVGDGIRQSVENIANFLQEHSGLHFTFSLVELAIFILPESAGGGFLTQPRVLARTVEIERAVIRLESPNILIEPPPNQLVTHKQIGRRVKVSDEEFYTALGEVDPEAAKELPLFLDRCVERGLVIGKGDSSRIIHWINEEGGKVNFGQLFKNGTVDTNYICYTAELAGDLTIGVRYLERLAALLGDYAVRKENKTWSWRITSGKRYPSVAECLRVQDSWLAIIDETIQEFMMAMDNKLP